MRRCVLDTTTRNPRPLPSIAGRSGRIHPPPHVAGAPSLAGAFATTAFNIGAALGPALGGVVIGAGLGYRSPLLVSATLVALFLVTAVSRAFPRPRNLRR